MYEKFYHLKEKPFSLLPDPEYFYLSKKHKMALTLLEYGILNQAGFCVVSGQAGAGKTTLVRYLLSLFDDDIDVGLLTNTHQSFDELLTWILLSFDQDYSGKTKAALYQTFADFLIKQYAQKRHTVLIIDEAQNMLPSTLEELRMLSNINSEKDQLLQIILVGQPKLLENLRRPDLKQFAQRVAVDYNLEQLDLDETISYIQHRLKVAGGHPAIFHGDACKMVYQYSKGVPRLINLLCDTAMVYGFAEQVKVIDANIITDVIKERDEQGMLARFEDLNEEVDQVLVEDLLKVDEPEVFFSNDKRVEEFEEKPAVLVAQATSNVSVERKITPSIQLVSDTDNVHMLQGEFTRPSSAGEEKDVLLQAMELSEENKFSTHEISEPHDDVDISKEVQSSDLITEINDTSLNSHGFIDDNDIENNIKEQENLATENSVNEQKLMDMANDKPAVPGPLSIQSVNSTGKLGFGFAGFSIGALLSIFVLVFFLFNKNGPKVEVVSQGDDVVSMKVFEERINSRLSGLEKERDAALSKLNTIQAERDAQLEQARAEERARAAELKAKLALQEEKLQAEKIANAQKREEMARLEREAQKRKLAEATALAAQRKYEQERVAAQQLKERLLQVQREQEIAIQKKLAAEKRAQKQLVQKQAIQAQANQKQTILKQPAEPVTELKPVKNAVPVTVPEEIPVENVANVSELKGDDTETKNPGFLSDPCKGPTARFMSNCKK